MKQHITKYKAIYLKWEDAMHPEECVWKEENDKFFDDGGYIVETIGWLIEESKTHYMVCLMHNEGGDDYMDKYGHLQRIPKGCVLKKKFLKI